MIKTKNSTKVALTLALLSLNAGLFAGNNASTQAGYNNSLAAVPGLLVGARTDKNGKGKNAEETYPQPKTAKFEEEGYMFSAQFLYWSTNYNSPFAFSVETSSSSSVSGIITTSETETENELLNPKQTWDPGVRLAFGMCTPQDDWDFALIWTYYHNSSHKKADLCEEDDDENIQAFWGSGSWEEGKTSARLNYNVADFELGKSYYLSQKVHLRPFIGLRAGILDQDQHACLTENELNATISGTGYEIDQPFDFDFDHDMWGVGPRIGVNTNWGSFKGFSIVGNISAALMYGVNKTKLEIEQTTAAVIGGSSITKTVTEHEFKQKNNELFPMLQMFLGFSWGHKFNNSKNSIRINAGWESNFWWESANTFIIDKTANVIGVMDKAVSVQGLTLEFRVGF